MSWKKTKGTFNLRRLDGTREVIPQGQVFQALPEEIPMAFRDTIKPVDPYELEARANPPLQVADPGFRMVARGKVPGRFNVVDANGKVMNEQSLTADQAKTLLRELSGS
jgi:hypothetical protein